MSHGFRGGIPYAVDVNRLKDEFPVPVLTEGRVINHAELEQVVKAKRGAQRYYGVINSWLLQMRNSYGVFMTWEASVGLKVLGPAEILGHAETRTRQKIRQTGHAVGLAAWVDSTRLDQMGQQRLDHYRRVTTAVKDVLNNARKQLAVDLAPIKSLPKPQVIREA